MFRIAGIAGCRIVIIITLITMSIIIILRVTTVIREMEHVILAFWSRDKS